jgi:hypothetical protein
VPRLRVTVRELALRADLATVTVVANGGNDPLPAQAGPP